LAKIREKLSTETKMKISQSKRGQIPWNKGKKYRVSNRKCSVDGCNELHHGLGYCKNHYAKFRRKNDTEYRDRINKNQLQKYYDNHEERKKRKRVAGRLGRIELYKKLGGKCESCGEKLDDSLPRINLQFHHKTYDEDDMRIKKKFKGNLGSKHHWEIKRMLKNGINPKGKFGLLCIQCNLLEAFVRMNPSKAFESFAWMYGEGHFDEALK